jgi:hypothetical protein
MNNLISVIFNAVDGITGPVKRIQGQVGAFTTKINASNVAMSVYANKAKASFSMFRGIGGYIAGTLATGSIIAFANKSIEKFEEYEASLASIRMALKTTGAVSGQTMDSLAKTADVLSSKSIFGSSKILSGVSQQLLTFKNIKGDKFARTEQIILDVVANKSGLKATTEDLQAWTVKIGKVLNSPSKLIGSLGRVGITFSATQTKIIKALEQSGKLGEAQAYILKNLEGIFGGQALALANTEAGKQILMQNKIAKSMRQIGEKLAPIKLKLLEIFEKVLDKLPPILNFLDKHKTLIKNIAGALIVYKSAQLLLNSAVLAYVGIMKLANIAKLVSPIGLIIAGISVLAALVFLVWKNWKPISKFFSDLWVGISDGFIKAYESVSNSINSMPFLIRGFVRIFFDLITLPVLIYKNWSKITAFFSKLWDGVKKIFRSAIDGLTSLIPDWLKSLIGIKSLAVSVQEKTVKNSPAVQSALKTINPLTVFGFNKPQVLGKNIETATSIQNTINTTKNIETFQNTKDSTMKENSEIVVRFENAPKGTRVDAKKAKKGVDWSMGYSGAW